ncbi:unnamed protein product [Cuscuta europaea]|uniref:Uncharacterized protein n=1 Tax=Cuscuta europaea TaxID=41803 RepID=A0A9P0VSP0_CUSEU|nr:unnamed protein product [Cuscuta europaea]
MFCAFDLLGLFVSKSLSDWPSSTSSCFSMFSASDFFFPFAIYSSLLTRSSPVVIVWRCSMKEKVEDRRSDLSVELRLKKVKAQGSFGVREVLIFLGCGKF